MAKVLVVNHVTLDGVMQGPGRPDEDTRGGFPHGGWAIPRNDDVMEEPTRSLFAGFEAKLLRVEAPRSHEVLRWDPRRYMTLLQHLTPFVGLGQALLVAFKLMSR
jgi:hypothetical protein